MGALDFFRGSRGSRSFFDEWDALTREFDRIFADFNRTLEPYRASSQSMVVTPACDIDETEAGYHFSLDMPGVPKDNIMIEVEGNRLLISGERQEMREEKDEGRHFRERTYGRFARAFTLPQGTDVDKIEAAYDNGVLSVFVPKSEHVKPKRIQIGSGTKEGFLKRLTGGGKQEEKKASNL